MFGIDVTLISKTGRPLSMMIPLSTDKRVKTRMKQYEAYRTEKSVIIAKEILKARIRSQKYLLDKYDLDSSKLNYNLDRIDVTGKTVDQIRPRLTGYEGKCSEYYFKQYWTLFPAYLQPDKREHYRAQSPLNNLLNLSYEVLKGEVYKAVLYAHLDPYLGYLHSVQFAKPSLVCDIQELFRYLIEDFLIQYHLNFDAECFIQKKNRTFLRENVKLKMITDLGKYFNQKIFYNRRNSSKTVRIRTAIREELIKLAQYLREKKASSQPSFIEYRINA